MNCTFKAVVIPEWNPKVQFIQRTDACQDGVVRGIFFKKEKLMYFLADFFFFFNSR